jgi:transcription initiation factor TFIIIB Brf1 subunit/transcription initiation factor TFIIB
MITAIDEFAKIIICSDSIIYASIYTTNPIVVVFHEKISTYSVFRVDALVGKVHVAELDADDFTFKIANMAPGSQPDQIAIMSEEGRLFVVKLKLGEQASIETIVEEFSIGSSTPVSRGAFKHSEVFIPVFIAGKLRGAFLASDIEGIEEFWFYLTHGETLFEYPFDAIAFNVYVNEARRGVSVLYVDYESIVLIQYDPQKVVSQSDTVFNIDFGAECHDEIIDTLFKHKYGLMLSINNRVITLWSPTAKYEYAADLLRFYTKTKDQTYDACYPTVNGRYAFVRKNGKLYHVNFSFGRVHESPLNSFNAGTGDQPVFEIQSDAEIYHLVHPKIFLVEEDFKYRLCLDNNEEKILTYSIHQGTLRGGDYFENLNNPDVCPPELRGRMLSALNLANVTVLDSRIEQMKVQQREIAEKKQLRFFTKDQDLQLLDELFSSKNYTDFAVKFQRTTMAVFFHVKTRFGLPRCDDHRCFTHECNKCQESLRAWRANGRKVVEEASYRTSTISPDIEPVTLETLSTTRRLGYFKRRMRESANSLCEMNKQLGLPEEIVSGAMNTLAQYTTTSSMVGRSEEQILFATLYIELKRTGNEMRAKDFLLQAERIATDRRRFKTSIIRVVQEIQRELGIRFGPIPLEGAFLNSPLARRFSSSELSAICAYLRALDARPRLTSGKARIAFIGAAIYTACKRIGARAWTQSKCADAVSATEVTIRNRAGDIQLFEAQISENELEVPVQLPDADVTQGEVDEIADEEAGSSTDDGNTFDDGTDGEASVPRLNGTNNQPAFSFDERVAAFRKISHASDTILGMRKSSLLDEGRRVLEYNIRTLKDERLQFDEKKPAEKLVIDKIDERIAMIETIIIERGDEGIREYFTKEFPSILAAHKVEIERIVSHVCRAYTSVDAAREIVTKFCPASPFIKKELESLVSARIRGQTLLSPINTAVVEGEEAGEVNGELADVEGIEDAVDADAPVERGGDESDPIQDSIEGNIDSSAKDLIEPPDTYLPLAMNKDPPAEDAVPPVDARLAPPLSAGQEHGFNARLPQSANDIIAMRKGEFFVYNAEELQQCLDILAGEQTKLDTKRRGKKLEEIRISEAASRVKQVMVERGVEPRTSPQIQESTSKDTVTSPPPPIIGTTKKATDAVETILKRKKSDFTGTSRIELVRVLSTLEAEKKRFNGDDPAEMLVLVRIAASIALIKQVMAGEGIDFADEFMAREFPKIMQQNRDKIAGIMNHVNQYYTSKDAARDIIGKYCDVPAQVKDRVVCLIGEKILDGTMLPPEPIKASSDKLPEQSSDPVDEFLLKEFPKIVEQNVEKIKGIISHVNEYYTSKDAARDIVGRFCKVTPEIKDRIVTVIAEKIRDEMVMPESIEKSSGQLPEQKPVPPKNRTNLLQEGLDYGIGGKESRGNQLPLDVYFEKSERSPRQVPPKAPPSLDRLKDNARRLVQMSEKDLNKESSTDLERYLDILEAEKMRFNRQLPEDGETRDLLNRAIILINCIKIESFARLDQKFITEDLLKIIKNNVVRIRDIVSHINQYYTPDDAAREIVQKYVMGSSIIKGKAADVIAERIREGTLFKC